MNDERLERELRAALLEDDPGPIRAELQIRVAAIPDAVALRPRLSRSSGARLVASAAAIAAIAVLGATLAFAVGLHSTLLGPSASGTPIPTSKANAPTSSGEVVAAGLLDPEHGWAVTSGRLVVTADGGSTWRDITPSPGFGTGSGVAFLDSQHGWVAINEIFSQMTDAAYGRIDIWRTTDGGQTWTRTELPKATIHRFGEILPRVQFDFLDASHGFAFLSGNLAKGREDSDLFWTADGGQTWSADRPTGPGGAGIEGAVGFATASDGVVAGSGAFVTHDSGRTWRELALEAPPGFEGAQAFFSLPAFFAGGQSGVLPVLYQSDLAHAMRIFRTSDAGANWSVASTVSANGAIAVIDERRWSIVSFTSPEVLHTDDGGATWTKTASRSSLADPQAAWFADDNDGWVVTGEFGSATLWATTDGGTTWRTLDPAAGLTSPQHPSPIPSLTPEASPDVLVPWLDATPTPEPTPTTARIPPGTLPCRTADLEASMFLGSGAMAGADQGSLLVTNTSAAPCTLDGPPSSIEIRAAGALMPVPFRAVNAPAPGTESFTAPGPALLQPGVQAYAWLSWDNWCGPTNRTLTMQAALPSGGGVLRLTPGRSVYPRCNASNAGSSMSAWRFQLPEPPPPNETVVTGRVAIAAPSTAMPGQVLAFTVTLTNLGATAAPLDPCPAYSETLIVNGAALKPPAYRRYVLNCAAMGRSIAAGTSVILQMRYPIPADVAPGQVELLWSLDPGSPFDSNSVVAQVPLTIVSTP